MMRIGLLVAGIGLGALVVLATRSPAQDHEERDPRGGFYSHNVMEEFDMSVGATKQLIPRKAERYRIIREQLNVPAYYGTLAAVTCDGSTAILWFVGGNSIRNVVVKRPDQNLYRLDLMPADRLPDRFVR